jgi:hypothetical protein
LPEPFARRILAPSRHAPEFVSTVERLRESFRPKRITALFVGESVPHSGKFFYRANSQAFKYMKGAFAGADDFLEDFKARGYFLDDLILVPANQMHPKERQQLRWSSVPSLAQRLSVYQPAMVIAIMIGIEPMVRAAMNQAGLSRLPFDSTPFPGCGQQGRFKLKMAEIIRKLQSTG